MQKVTTRDQLLKDRWEKLVEVLTDKFSDGAPLDVEGMLYLIGLQELGQIHRKFKKDDNIDLIHIGICTALEPFGYYRFDFFDEQGWPHFELTEELPPLKAGEQSVLMKEAIVEYFLNRKVIK
jgi:hypothetical protein